MPRQLLPLVALLALFCTAPLHAQDNGIDVDPILGTWELVKLNGDEAPEQRVFRMELHADGSGVFSGIRGGEDAFEWHQDLEAATFTLVDGGGEVIFSVELDGDVLTLSSEEPEWVWEMKRLVDAPENRLTQRGQVQEQADDHDAHALIGTWVGLTMDGEELEEGDFVLVFNADATGTINEGGDRPEPFTYTYDPDTQRCVIFFDGDEDDAFPIDVSIDGDTATFAPEDEDVLVARRIPVDDDADPMPEDDRPDGAIPPPPAPVDTSDSPLMGRWMLVQFNGEAVPDGLVAYDHHDDGTGRVLEEGEPGDTFGWQHDLERGVVTVQPPEGETMTFQVILYEDLAIYFSEDMGGLRIVHRRMPIEGDAGDAGAQAPDVAPMVGEWEGVSNNGEPVDPDDSVRLIFHPDGSGDLYEDGDENDPFTWSYDAQAESCTITADGDRMKFHVSFDDDTMTFESDDGDMFLVMRRIEADAGNDAGSE